MDIRVVVPMGDHCGEAATWDGRRGVLLWTDVNRFLVHELAPQTGQTRSWFFDEPCVALSLTEISGLYLLALGSRLILWRPDTDERHEFGFALDGWPRVRLNDGRPGPKGEFFIGSMGNNVGPDGSQGEVNGFHGRLFRISASRPPQEVRSGIGISNTVCFSPDRRHFYFGDTIANVVWRYDYDRETGEITNPQAFFEGFARGRPDGSTIDAEGYLWNCRFGGGCIVRVAPDGTIDKIIDMPVTNITTCEFGGERLETLYVTSASILLNRHERLAGALFAIEGSARGVPALHFKTQ